MIIAIYLGIAIYLLPMYPHGGSANEMTRWATAASLIEKGSFEISWTEPLIGPNVDAAKVGDRTYSNKAPGTAILAAPFYALTRIFVGPPNASNIRISWFAMRFALSTLPLLLLAIWLYRRGTDEFSLALLFFATPLFLYSLLFFSHVFVAVAVYFAFRLIYDETRGGPKVLVIAGVLSGLAVVSEFPAVFAVSVFGVGLFFKDKETRASNLFYFAIGGLPFLLFLLAYNNALFGSPFSMSYAHESFPEWAEVAGQGVFGIGVPSLSNAYLLLLSPSRGLLFSSPVLILSVIAFVRSFDRNNVRRMVRLAAVAICVIIICGHGAAHGGWAFGPRYLIFIVPLILDPFFEHETPDIPGVWKGVLLGASVLLCVLPSLTFPFAPPEFSFPHNKFWASFMSGEGWFVPDLANVFGLTNSGWWLFPVLIAVVVAIYLVARSVQQTALFAAGFAIAILVVGVYVLLPTLGNPAEDAFRRATIAERFFKPADRMNQFATQTDGAALRRVNDANWTIADAKAFAPDDWPYRPVDALPPSVTVRLRNAIQYGTQGNTAEAETLLKSGKDQFPFARCEFATNLAVIYFTTNRPENALAELEEIQPLINTGSRPECQRAQFMLGSIYKEKGRTEDANSAFQRFLANTANNNDAEIQAFRKQLVAK